MEENIRSSLPTQQPSESLFENWEKLQLREQQLITQLKQRIPQADENSPLRESIICLEKQIREVLQQKCESLRSIIQIGKQLESEVSIKVPTSPQSSSPLSSNPLHSDTEDTDVEDTVVVDNSLIIAQQPSDYVYPHPSVKIPEHLLAQYQSCQIIVSVDLLCCSQSDAKVKLNDSYLHGLKRIMMSTGNLVVFNKIRLKDVPSTFQGQTFCLEFTLEVVNHTNIPLPISSVRTNTFILLGGVMQPTLNNKRKREEEEVHGETVILLETPVAVQHASDNYVDITNLLNLPQKTAAAKLGISESMLCKRFKERTKRKWPYRYVRKVDKMIKQLQVDAKDCDNQKLEQLQQERQFCLQPVKIRISAGDRSSPIEVPSYVPPSVPPQIIPEDSAELSALQSLAMLNPV